MSRVGWSERLPAEIEILVLCARRTLEASHRSRLGELLDGEIDLDQVIELGGRHGLVPLLHRHLGRLPVPDRHREAVARLRALQAQNALTTLHLARTLLNLLEELSRAGIRAVPYKGPVLASQLYGEVGLRQAGDLDILIPREDAERAVRLALSLGFDFRYPLTDEARDFRFASRYSEELIRGDGTRLELHWAFANRDVRFGLTFEEAETRFDQHTLAGTAVPTLGREDLLLVLAVHGAKHRWDRLEWITGVAEAIRGASEVDWPTLIERSKRLRVHRTLLLALVLAHDLLEAPVPADVLEGARSIRWVGRLATDVLRRLYLDPAYAGSRAEVLSRNLFQLPLQQGTDRLRYLVYRSTTPNRPHDWKVVRIGSRPVPLHAFRWPFTLVQRMITRAFRIATRTT